MLHQRVLRSGRQGGEKAGSCLLKELEKLGVKLQLGHLLCFIFLDRLDNLSFLFFKADIKVVPIFWDCCEN